MNTISRRFSRTTTYLRAAAGLTLLASASFLSAPATHAQTATKTIYVSATTGSDTGTGQLRTPFKTLTKALTVAQTGDIVHLKAGVYSQPSNGETYDPDGWGVKAGLTIEGDLDGTLPVSVIAGTGSELGLHLSDGDTLRNLDIRKFTIGAFAGHGTQTLDNVRFSQSAKGYSAEGTAQATISNSAFSVDAGKNIVIGLEVKDQAKLTLRQTTFTGTADCTQFRTEGIAVSGSAQASISQAAFTGLTYDALGVSGTSVTTLDTASIATAQNDACSAVDGVYTWEKAKLTITNASFTNTGTYGRGITSYSTAALKVQHATFDGYDEAAIYLGDNTPLTVTDGTFTHNYRGIGMRPGTFGTITVSDSSFVNNTIGIDGRFLTVHNTSVFSNAKGIVLQGSSADLGTQSQPGNNHIQGNTIGVTFTTSAVSEGYFTAYGNTWNANTQGADANGLYPTHQTITGASPLAHGSNFDLPTLKFYVNL